MKKKIANNITVLTLVIIGVIFPLSFVADTIFSLASHSGGKQHWLDNPVIKTRTKKRSIVNVDLLRNEIETSLSLSL